MSDRMIPPAGDPFALAARREATDARLRERLARLRDRYAHEMMDHDERLELRDEIGRLRRLLASPGEGR